jgi:NACHT domain
MFRVERPLLVDQIWKASSEGSVLLTGSPGAGKSWALAQFIRRCKAAKRPVLALVAEDLDVRSVEELGSALGLKKDVPAFLEGLGARAVLVIDGLDALRAERTQRPMRDLIRIVGSTLPQCAIVVSLRTYDLQQSSELQRLFAREYAMRSFTKLSVSSFSDEEIHQALKQVSGLSEVFQHASGDFRDLLRNPFNLHLAVGLLTHSATSGELSALRSQSQLLFAYWAHRVDRPPDGYDRKALLRGLLRSMVEKKTLSLAEESAYSVGQAALLDALQSDEILRRSATDRVSFTHNILCDYALARVVLNETSIESFIADDPSRTIFFRPSLSFFFHHLWDNDRKLFWTVALRFFTDATMPARAQVIPAVVIYEAAQTADDLNPLVEANQQCRNAGVAMVLRAVQTFGGVQSRRRSLWLRFLSTLTPLLNLYFVNEYLALVVGISDGLSHTGEKVLLGEIARSFLLWMWGAAETEQGSTQLGDMGAMRVLPVVLRFYETDIESSRQIVLRVLDRCAKPTSGSHEAFSLAQHIGEVVQSDPALAAEVYKRLFRNRVTSEEKTLLGGSSVMQFTSTRRQDYSLALYGLQQAFPTFLELAPLQAALAAAASLNAEFEGEDRYGSDPNESFDFHLGADRLRYLSDRSEIWDSSGPDHLSLNLFDSALHHAAKRLGDRSSDEIGAGILRTIISNSQRAVAWKHLIEAAALQPGVLYSQIMELLTIPEFISAPETTIAVGNLLKAAYAQNIVSDEDADLIERALDRIPDTTAIIRYEKPESILNRLILCIPAEQIRSEPLRALAMQLADSKQVRDNTPYVRFSGGAVSEEDWLRLQGIDPDSSDNSRVLEVIRPLEAFVLQFANGKPSLDECASIEPIIERLEALIPELTPSHSFVDRARGAVFSAAETILKNEALADDSHILQRCRSIVLRGSVDSQPEFDPEQHSTFDNPAWGVGQPRIEAAQGLRHLLWNYGPDPEVTSAIDRLSRDPVPAVRLQIADGLLGFYKHKAFDQFWKLTQQMIRSEKTTGVLTSLVSMVGRIVNQEPDRVFYLVRPLLPENTEGSERGGLVGVLLDLVVWLYVGKNQAGAREQLLRISDDPIKYHSTIGQAVFRAAHYLRSDSDEERMRARTIMERSVSAVYATLATHEAVFRGNDHRDDFFRLLHILDEVSFRICSTLDANEHLRGAESILSRDERETLYNELRPLIELVCLRSGYTGTHYLSARSADLLLQTLDVVLMYAPAAIVACACSVCRASARLEYAFDPMAVGRVVKFVEHVLADHKDVLRDGSTAQELGDIIDIFVRAGWPEAMRLLFTMDQAIR